jgi:hypothetical protein
MKIEIENSVIEQTTERMMSQHKPFVGIKQAYTFMNVQLTRLYGATLDMQSRVGII